MSNIARKLMGVKKEASYFAFTDVVFDPIDRSTYTFTDVDIGTPKADRVLVLHVYALAAGGAGNNPLTSVTVNSVSATKILGPVLPGGSGRVYMYAVELPSDDTATVVVSLNLPVFRCVVGVYALYGYASTPTATASNSSTLTTSSALSSTLSVTSRDAVLCSGQINSNQTATSISWGSSFGTLVEDYDFNPESRYVSAAAMTADSTGSLTVSMTPVGGVTAIREMAVAAFSPL